jgi:AcrR family transcriptional regulator
MPTQAERRTATTDALIAAAREAFVTDGFHATSVDEVAVRVGMSKGAVYHHYSSKVDLFRAVFESVEAELQQLVIRRAAKTTDPIDQIIAGNDAFLDAATNPAIGRITLIEAPAVLGWTMFREIDERYFMGLLMASLNAANGKRRTDEAARLQARVAFAGLCELAVAVATSDHPSRTLKLAKSESRRLVRGLIAETRRR